MELGLFPSITRPTRITHSTATLIDNILIDQKFSENYKSSVLIDNISDHLPCLTTLCGIASPRNRDKTLISRDIRKKNLENLHHKLQNTDWGFLDDHLDVNSKFNTFHDNFCLLRERKIKYKNIRREPWLTPGLMISLKKCKRLYKISIKVDKMPKVAQYVDYNTCLRKVGSQKIVYIHKCAEFKHNTRKWGTINKICGKSNDKAMCIESLKVNNVRLTILPK